MPKAVRLLPYVPAVLALWAAVAPTRADDEPLPPSEGGLFLPYFPPAPPDEPDLPNLPPLVPAAPEGPPSGEGPTGFTLWDTIQPGELERRKLLNRTEGDWGMLSSEVVFRAPEPSKDAPFERGEWSTEDTLHIPVTGPLFLFGQTVLVGDYAADQEMKVVGRTGVLWKVPVGVGPPLEVRGGPAVKYKDALRAEGGLEQAEVFLEVQAKMPVLGSIGLEYLGEALPGMTPAERPRLTHDLGLAIPVSGGKVKLGAKQRWDSLQQEAGPWGGATQLYVGIEIGR